MLCCQFFLLWETREQSQEPGSCAFSLMPLNATLSSLSNVLVLLDMLVLLTTVFSPKPVSASCPVNLTLLCPTVSPSFSALSSDFQHVLSGFADQKAICSQPPPSLLGTSSHILSIPQHFPCFVLGFRLCFLTSMGRGLCHRTVLSEIASSQRLPWRTSSILHLQRPRPQYLPLSYHSLWLALQPCLILDSLTFMIFRKSAPQPPF